MADKKQERIVELQRQLKIAKDALERIVIGAHQPAAIASVALDKMWPLDRKQPLQYLVDHEKQPRA